MRLKQIELLESDLGSATAPRDPPWLGWSNAGLVNWGRLGFITGKSRRGVRWIGDYKQDFGPLDNPLGYTVEAITNDDRYLILMYREIQYLNPPADVSQLSAQQIQDLDDPKVFRAFQRKVDASLTNARPESFQPSMDQLDAAIRSVEFH